MTSGKYVQLSFHIKTFKQSEKKIHLISSVKPLRLASKHKTIME